MLPKPGLSSVHLGCFVGCMAQATDYELLLGVGELTSETAMVRLMLKRLAA
ncbi:hypothetical protein H6G97_50950 [Nostoc flagelliforme FACHB-838]|uniref:Transposase n=1 Tax=Nostoc flagelliforme FACHB-838 TaxID=2692904 RepID=A0ABR8E620_9NOSO|nr:hypothetical protein [Nostoc flagelliforme]MBD2537076.1 hypothetical protein [Nostoc flagelliforme FACHB-838]